MGLLQDELLECECEKADMVNRALRMSMREHRLINQGDLSVQAKWFVNLKLNSWIHCIIKY